MFTILNILHGTVLALILPPGDLASNLKRIATPNVAQLRTTYLPLASQYLIHFPKHPGCEACQQIKTQKQQRRPRERDSPESMPLGKPSKFGDIIAADHLELTNEVELFVVFLTHFSMVSHQRHGCCKS